MKNTTIFKRLLGYLKAYRLRLFFVLLSAVISTAFMVLAPFLVGKVTTTLFASIADKVFYWETIIWLLAALVALYFVSQLRGRHDAFNLSHERQSNKHLFSTLIKCKECGWSFRRTVRTYKNTYVRWVCSGRNGRGVDSCPNKTVVDEEELIEVLQEYFTNVLKQKKKVIAHVVNEFQRVYKAKDENIEYEKELNAELAKLQKTRQKYMDMYTDDLISREELNEKIGGSRQEMERIENELKMVSYHLTKGEQLENILNNTFKEIEDITDVHQMTNQQLKRLIQKIEVDKEGNVDIYLRLLGDLGLDESVLIEENETVLNCDDQT